MREIIEVGGIPSYKWEALQRYAKQVLVAVRQTEHMKTKQKKKIFELKEK